jgi:arylsulfatase A-like enzyme
VKRKQLAFVFMTIAILACPKFSSAIKNTRPNFVVIVTDDQNLDEFTDAFMPKTFERIVQQGALFTNAFVTTPLCCPSRASIFTGLLARHHGIVRNAGKLSETKFDQVPRFPEELKNAGYFTGLVGKYLNFWNGSWRKKEFDFWVSYPYRAPLDWFNYTLIKNDHRFSVKNKYITDQLLSYSLEFLDQAAASHKPFLLYFATPAPHGPAVPALRHQNLYQGMVFARPPSFNEFDLSDKPRWMRQRLPTISAETISGLDAFHINQLETLAAVDEAIDSILKNLEDHGLLDQTMIIFLSDNGIFFGQHRLQQKGLFYEESVHVPMAIRYPPLIQPRKPIVFQQMVANIDLAPTIYDVAGLAPPPMDGSSLVPLLRNQTTRWRKELLLEGWPDAPGGAFACSPPFTAVRTSRYVYSETYANTGTGAIRECTFSKPDTPELYDLKIDPFQIQNVALDPRYDRVRKKLKTRLDQYGYVQFPHKKRN